MYPSDVHQTWNNGPYDSDYYHYVDDFIKTLQPEIVAFDYYPLARHRCILECDWWRDMGLMRQKANEYGSRFGTIIRPVSARRRLHRSGNEGSDVRGIGVWCKVPERLQFLGRMYRANGEKAPISRTFRL